MGIKIFSNNSTLNAEEELEIVNSRMYNLGNTNYYVDSTKILECNDPYDHGNISITICESISEYSVFSLVEENCRKLINRLGETDVTIDKSSVRLLSLYKSYYDFISNVKSGYDYDTRINDISVEYLENRTINYPRSKIKKRGPNLNPIKIDRNNPFRAIVNNGNDFRNVPYTKAPYSSAVMIIAETAHSVGSGVFISPRVILTCRHNFYNDDGSFMNSTYVYVQGSNSPSNPPDVTSGSKTQIDVSKVYIVDGDYEPVSPTDFAVVITETPCEITYPGGTYSEIIKENINKENMDISIIGYPYPNNIPEVKDRMQHGYLYESSGKIGGIDSGMITYRIDTLGGNSGSGVFNNGKVVGIHVGGIKNVKNTAVDINESKIKWLEGILENNKTDGWYEHNGNRYYYENNIMFKDTQREVDGHMYTFDINGIATNVDDNSSSSNGSNDSNDSNGSNGSDGSSSYNGSGKRSSTTVGNNGTHLWRFNDFAMWNGDTKQGSTNSAVNNDINNSGNSSPNGSGSNNSGQLSGNLKEAVDKALDSSNWNATTDSGNPGIDVDGFPAGRAAQCFDLANYYLMSLGIGWDRTKVDAWGVFNFPLQYKSQFESLGWKLIEHPSLSQLVPGSITFENDQGVGLGEVEYGGHTEIITSIEGNNISFLTQNPNSPTIVTVDGGGEPKGYGYRIQLIAVPPGS